VSEIALAIAILVPLLGVSIRFLNFRHLRANRDAVPEGFEAMVDAGTLAKMSDYASQTGRLAIWQDIATQGFVVAALFGGLIGTWDLWIARVTFGPIGRGILYFFLMSLGLSILSLPFDIYRDFVVEQKHGFNRSTKLLFLMDFIKSQALSGFFIAIVAAVALWLIEWSNQHWWFWVWLFLVGFQIFVALIAPNWIEPLFTKVKPLEDENLGAGIRAMAARAQVRVDRIFQVDASRRSSHTNAYFSGFGPVKRVVLYDTLLEKLEPSEILGVLAHELGHWRLRHVVKSLVIFQVVSLLACAGAHWLVNWDGLEALFGLGHVSLFTRLTLTLYLGSLVSAALTPVFSAFSRRNEWQADAFACKLAEPGALASGLVKLARDNLSNLHPHPIYVAIFASHPPTVARVRKLRSMSRGAPAT